jgi:hypothetical protein
VNVSVIGYTGELEVDVEGVEALVRSSYFQTKEMGVPPSAITLTPRSPLRKEDRPAHGRPAGAGTPAAVRSG